MGAYILTMDGLCFVDNVVLLITGTSLLVTFIEDPLCDFQGFTNLSKLLFEGADIFNNNY